MLRSVADAKTVVLYPIAFSSDGILAMFSDVESAESITADWLNCGIVPKRVDMSVLVVWIPLA